MSFSATLWKTKDEHKELAVVTTADDLAGKRIGGVRSFLEPEASAVYFQSLIGREISAYREYDSFDEAVAGLKNGDVDAVWACDVTAEYAVKKYGGLDILDNSDMAATARLAQPRFSFAFAMRRDNDKNVKKEQQRFNDAINKLRSDGTVSSLYNDYIKNGAAVTQFYEEDMWSRTDRFRDLHEMSGSIDVGITGAAPPVEIIDESGRPCGFCVAFLDELACELCTDINIRILDTETAYSELMAGKVDYLFASAASDNTTQEEKKYLTSDGYMVMNNYRFLVRSTQEPSQEENELTD
jgi:ABC-type amino acid transport substrate-binding protein